MNQTLWPLDRCDPFILEVTINLIVWWELNQISLLGDDQPNGLGSERRQYHSVDEQNRQY